MYQLQNKKTTLFLRILFVILLVTSFEQTCAYVCSAEFCLSVDCSSFPTKETCEGEIVPNSSICGCCSTCHIHTEEGGKCSVLLHSILGPPSDTSYHCNHDLECIDGKCVQVNHNI